MSNIITTWQVTVTQRTYDENGKLVSAVDSDYSGPVDAACSEQAVLAKTVQVIQAETGEGPLTGASLADFSKTWGYSATPITTIG